MKFLGALAIVMCGLLRAASSASAPPPPEEAHAADVVDSVLPTLEDTTPRELPGLHNVVAFYENYISGGVPKGDEGFDTLAKIGVKTIISVDGAVPDVEKARARGIRYIHLPIGYDGLNQQRKLELVRASRDAMQVGPVYIHCHHGKHRSAGAAAAVAASLGWLTTEVAIQRMNVSGTAPGYKGLYKCAAESTPLQPERIDAVPPEFPEIRQPESFVKSMIEIDHINEHLKLIEAAGWGVPEDHPDLVPVAEAGRMADLFRGFRLALETENVKTRPIDFIEGMKENGDLAQLLEELLLAEQLDTKKLSATMQRIQNSCMDCHTLFRD